MPFTLEDEEEIGGVIARYDFAMISAAEKPRELLYRGRHFPAQRRGNKSKMAEKVYGSKKLHDFCSRCSSSPRGSYAIGTTACGF